MAPGETIAELINYSIIVPTLNRATVLRRCLTHLAELAFEQDLYEVLVIDNGSTDDTKETTLAFGTKIKNLRYIYCEIPGLVAARHKGLEESRGEILCFIDDDSFASKGWLKGVADAFSGDDIFLVGGPCLPEYEIEPPGWLGHFWSETPWGGWLTSLSLLDFGLQTKAVHPVCVFGCNFNIKKNILLEIGGFHPDAYPREMIRYRGDGESHVCDELSAMGIMGLYWPAAKIRHFVPASRMTKEYFCHRGYVQGVSKSFAQIRKMHGLSHDAVEGNNGLSKGKRGKGKRTSVKGVDNRESLSRVKNWLNYKLELCRKGTFNSAYADYLRIKYLVQKTQEDGVRFHRAEVRRDPKLLEWVLRENYLGVNGKIPL